MSDTLKEFLFVVLVFVVGLISGAGLASWKYVSKSDARSAEISSSALAFYRLQARCYGVVRTTMWHSRREGALVDSIASDIQETVEIEPGDGHSGGE